MPRSQRPRSRRTLAWTALALLALVTTLAWVRLEPVRPDARIVAAFDSPLGPVERARPFVLDVEVRGADRVRWSGGGWTERPADLVDWTRVRQAAARLHELELADPALPAALLAPLGATRYHAFLRLDERGEVAAFLEFRVEPLDRSAARSDDSTWTRLPWQTEAPARVDGTDLEGEIDLSTGAWRAMREVRSEARGTGEVFDPNPIVASGGLPLRDGAAVDQYRVARELLDLDGTGRLRGARVDVQSRDLVRAEERSLFFDYRSTDPRFEEVMAYAHADRALRRADELGFRGVRRDPLRVVVHASAVDNSWYSRVDRGVFFGDGGVDDAEDADIILHELGHVLHDALVPGFGAGDTQAISEGFSDFWAASLTDDPCVGDWDATSYGPPCLRRVDTAARYPDTATGRPHGDGQIWSGLLWDIRGRLGAERTERLALAAFLRQGTTTRFSEAGASILSAATDLGYDADLPVLRELLNTRGLLPRRFDWALAGAESARISLPPHTRILGRPARALRATGEAELAFELDDADADSIACVSFSPLAPDAPPLPGAAGTLLRWDDDGERILIDLSNPRGAEGALRVRVAWDPDSGALEWTYLELPASPREGMAMLALPMVELPPPLISFADSTVARRLSGFSAYLGADEAWIGATLRAEASGDDRFQLSRRDGFSGSGLALVAAPNPMRGSTTLRLYSAAASAPRLSIHDALGRLVADLSPEGGVPPGLSLIPWDGRDLHGRELPAGIYFARARLGGSQQTARLIRLSRGARAESAN